MGQQTCPTCGGPVTVGDVLYVGEWRRTAYHTIVTPERLAAVEAEM